MASLGPKSKKQEMILTNKAKVLFAGGAAGSGKSYLLLLSVLQYVDCPYWRGVIFRRTQPELRDPGGLFDEAMSLYMSLPNEHRPTPKLQDLSFKFPSGAVLKLAGMEHDKDRMRWHGSQLTWVAWDELCTFSEVQYWYLMSRLRSKSKYPTMVRATMNPDPDSFVLDIISWWINKETGFPIEERAGIIRWYIRRDGDLVWGDSEKELKEKYGSKVRPVSFTFIPATIKDNPVVLKNNPDYLADLQSLKRVDRDRLLLGNWLARESSSGYFKRAWLLKETHLPSDATSCRCWDKASSEVSEKEKRPDFTASIKMYKDSKGEFWLAGEFDTSCNFDPVDKDMYGKFRHRAGVRDKIIERQGFFDGFNTIIVLPQDPGAAGHTDFMSGARQLTSLGFVVKKDPGVTTQSKLQKFLPFASACENGLVHIVESTFPNKHTLDAFLTELESFDLDKSVRSTRSRKDDWVDCCSGCFNFLSKSVVIPKFSLPLAGINNNIRKLKSQVA